MPKSLLVFQEIFARRTSTATRSGYLERGLRRPSQVGRSEGAYDTLIWDIRADTDTRVIAGLDLCAGGFGDYQAALLVQVRSYAAMVGAGLQGLRNAALPRPRMLFPPVLRDEDKTYERTAEKKRVLLNRVEPDFMFNCSSPTLGFPIPFMCCPYVVYSPESFANTPVTPSELLQVVRVDA